MLEMSSQTMSQDGASDVTAKVKKGEEMKSGQRRLKNAIVCNAVLIYFALSFFFLFARVSLLS